MKLKWLKSPVDINLRSGLVGFLENNLRYNQLKDRLDCGKRLWDERERTPEAEKKKYVYMDEKGHVLTQVCMMKPCMMKHGNPFTFSAQKPIEGYMSIKKN